MTKKSYQLSASLSLVTYHLISLSPYYLLLLLSLVTLFACSSTPSEYVGRVNKNDITLDEYGMQILRFRANFINTYQLQPNAQEQRRLQDDAWKYITDSYALKDIFDKYKVPQTTYIELIDTLRTNPPQGWLTNSIFVDDDGEFNWENYNSSLRSDDPVDLTLLKSFYRTTYIPRKKLQKIVLADRTVDDPDKYFDDWLEKEISKAKVVDRRPKK